MSNLRTTLSPAALATTVRPPLKRSSLTPTSNIVLAHETAEVLVILNGLRASRTQSPALTNTVQTRVHTLAQRKDHS